jgi:hypothetical protein
MNPVLQAHIADIRGTLSAFSSRLKRHGHPSDRAACTAANTLAGVRLKLGRLLDLDLDKEWKDGPAPTEGAPEVGKTP